MNPIQAAVARPYTVAVAVILAVLFGVLALRDIPVQLKPQVDTPRITISTGFRGAGAVEVEEQLTRELEEVLQSVEGLTEMVSASSEGNSAITLEFDFGTDTRLAVVDVINKLSRVQRMPPEADEPNVSIDGGALSQTVMWVAIQSGMSADNIRRIVEEDVRAQLERVPGVASIMIAGGSEREINVRLDPEALVAHGVTVPELLAALGRGNLNVRGGTVETPGRQLVVRTVGRAPRPEDLHALIVKDTDAGSVRLSDVAQVIDGFRERTGFVNINGRDGVALGIQRQANANVVEVANLLRGVLVELNQTFERRGLDLFLYPTFDETSYIRDALDFVVSNLWLGAGLAVFVLLVFLRSLRSVAVVALSIPVSLVTVFLVFQALDRTLNVISLAGIAFASGMVVDNAIVVLENIFRHLERGKSAARAAIDGGSEVWGGVLASTLTTIAVFVPVLLQEDEASALFADMALAISAAVALSLLVALSVVPVLASLLYRNTTRDAALSGSDDEHDLGALGRLYARFTDSLADSSRSAVAGKLGFTLIIVALALVSLQLRPPAEYLPTGNRNMVMFFAEGIPGTRVEAVREGFAPFEQFLLAQPEVDRTFSVAGIGFNGGGVVLKEEFADGASLVDFHQRMMGPAAALPGFRFFVPVRSSLFEDPGKQFEVELSGPDLAGLESASAQLQQRLMGVDGVSFVRSSLVTGRPQLTVRVDEQRAKDLGLDVEFVGTVVSTMVAGQRSSALIDAGREVEINVLAPPERVDSREALESLRFVTPSGEQVALADVAYVERTAGPESVRRLERERNVLLTVNINEATPLEQVVDAVEDQVFPELALQLGPAYTLGVGGSADKLRSTLRALSGGFGLSVLIVYLLLVSLFRSWFTPVVILVTVPLALTGGLVGITLAHTLSGGQAGFDVIAMLGFVILAGLVVNNAILIVHQANNLVSEGADARRALARAARSRLRPILMTVITTVSAMIPLAVGGGAGAELYQGLGSVIVGGLLVSTLFTLFLVPVLLSLGQDLSEALGRGRARVAPAVVTES
ncbi:MAG: multidrug ABC transporter [Planctomycetota bacterium]|nr:MAG: multidrug ABC transporter [Planctomycetota bacterium]